MIDRSQIKRGLYLKGGEYPGQVMTKDLSPEARHADVLAALKARHEALARDLEATRLKLSVRKWKRLHSL